MANLTTDFGRLRARIDKLTEERDAAEARLAKAVEALERISRIEDQKWGRDWQEIELAREIARAALAAQPAVMPDLVPLIGGYPVSANDPAAAQPEEESHG